MSSQLIQIIVLAGIALFLLLKLRDVLGTRDGFEPKTSDALPDTQKEQPSELQEDEDITDYFDAKSVDAKALKAVKEHEPDFTTDEFLAGARAAHEMILMAFENNQLEDVQPFLAEDVYNAFAEVTEHRKAKGITIQATFNGMNTKLMAARFDPDLKSAEIDVRFIAELIYTVTDKDGKIIEGGNDEVKKEISVWTFARTVGAEDPNWRLVATGE